MRWLVPDGILTNSSLQYVRDNIEEMYRIVAVVSMPQTAFTATGAGVKSSVLFLRKHDKATTERIKQQKASLQSDILSDYNYLQRLQEIDDAKKQHLAELRGFDNEEDLSGKALRDSQAYKEWRKEVSEYYRQQVDALKEELLESYDERRQEVLDDYPILMAIAEDIGYDATGKETHNSELGAIGEELNRFIRAVEQGQA